MAQTDTYKIDLTKNIPEPRYTMQIAGTGFAPIGDIVAVKGKAKVGKTYFLSIITSVILGQDFGRLRHLTNNASVLFFDTEQSPNNTARVARRIHTLLHWSTSVNNPRLKLYSLRSMDIHKRKEYIEAKIRYFHPTVAIIDGIVDLALNFNDIEESTALVEWLMKLSANNNCLIITALHENKSKEDNNMRGHLGTALANKCADILQLTRTSSSFNIEQTETRNAPIAGIRFNIDDNGIPYPTPSQQEQKTIALRNNIQNILNTVFKDHKPLPYKTLCEEYAIHAALGIDSAKKYIRKAMELNLLTATNHAYIPNSVKSVK